MVDQVRETDTDQPDHRRAGCAYDRPLVLMFFDVFPGGLRDNFRGRGHLIDIAEAHMDQGGQYNVNIIEVVELAVEGRGRKGHRIFIISENVRAVIVAAFGMVIAYADTVAAVNTVLAGDHGTAFAYPDRLGRAALDAVDTAVTQIFI